MREVDRPLIRPMRCAVIPYVGQSNRGERWVDTEAEMPGGFDNRVYVSASGVRALLQALRWPQPNEFRELRAERDRLAEQVERAQAELAELRRFRDSVHTLKDAGYSTARRPGRPKQEVA